MSSRWSSRAEELVQAHPAAVLEQKYSAPTDKSYRADTYHGAFNFGFQTNSKIYIALLSLFL
jgi:hypothetical protein